MKQSKRQKRLEAKRISKEKNPIFFDEFPMWIGVDGNKRISQDPPLTVESLEGNVKQLKGLLSQKPNVISWDNGPKKINCSALKDCNEQ